MSQVASLEVQLAKHRAKAKKCRARGDEGDAHLIELGVLQIEAALRKKPVEVTAEVSAEMRLQADLFTTNEWDHRRLHAWANRLDAVRAMLMDKGDKS